MDIGWRLARQEHFVRQRSAQFPDSVECERHRSIAEMVDALGSPLVDRIADQGYAVAHRQVPHAAPDIAVQILDKVLQRPAQGRRVPHQIADETKAPRIGALPEQKAKMCASCSHRAHLEQFARRGEGHRVLGIAEHAKVKPDVSRNVSGIDAELPEEHRRLRERPDTLLSLRHVLPNLPAAVRARAAAMRRDAIKKQH